MDPVVPTKFVTGTKGIVEEWPAPPSSQRRRSIDATSVPAGRCTSEGFPRQDGDCFVQFDLDQIDHLLSTTRAVRRRLDLDRPVPDELLLRCIDLAEQAPSGGNLANRRWLVVKDPETKHQLADLYRAVGIPSLRGLAAQVEGTRGTGSRVFDSALYLAENLERVPALVIVTIEGVHDGSARPGLYSSVLQSAWSFCLAARSRGLGTAWTTLHLNRAAETAELLGIPDGFSQVVLFPVAWTIGGDFKPVARRPAAEITYFDQWGFTKAPTASGDGGRTTDRPCVTCDIKIAADLQLVWELLAELSNGELAAAEWGGDGPPESTIAPNVTLCDPPRVFAWSSEDLHGRATHWQFRLEPTILEGPQPQPGTLLVYSAAIGPEHEQPAARTDRQPAEGTRTTAKQQRDLRDSMMRTLQSIRGAAERSRVAQ